MKIAVLSDIHDHIEILEKVIKQIKGETKAVIFCGDMCAPFTAELLGRVNLPIYACLGNNDEDQIGLFRRSGKNYNWVALHQEFGEVGIDKRKIAFCHYQKLAELLAQSGDYNTVFYGHKHITRNETVGKTLLVNPGALCGINPRKIKYEKATYAIYDTKTNSAKIIEITSSLP